MAHAAGSKGSHLKLQLAGFDLRDIQDVVDQVQQGDATRADRFGLFARLLKFKHHVGELLAVALARLLGAFQLGGAFQQPLFGLFPSAHLAAQFQLIDYEVGQPGQALQLGLAGHPRLHVDYAQRPQRVAVWRDERSARIKPNLGPAGDKRIL